MQALETFVFDDEQPHPIRVVLREGEPWFVAKDVCAVLGIVNNRDALTALDDDEVGGVGLTYTPSNQHGAYDPVEQEVKIVSEGGLYTLILRSRQAVTPGSMAHRFRRWVTGELLPQVRKTGRYAPEPGAGWDWEEIEKKCRLVDRVRLSFGRGAAMALWRELGLPLVEEPTAPVRGSATEGIDFVRQFLAERTEEAPGGRVKASELFRAFNGWCAATGAPPMTQTAFGMCMRQMPVRKKQANIIYYLGIRILHMTELAL